MTILVALLCAVLLSGLFGARASAAVPAKGVTGFFGAPGAAGGQLTTPRGVAVNQSSGTVYAVDGGNNRVVAFDSSGKFLRAFGVDVVASGPGQASEVQAVAVNATAGNFKLTFSGQTTSDLPASATPGEVQAALNALPTIGQLNPAGSVTVTGGPGDAGASSPYRIVFGGSLALTDVAQLTATNVSLSGGSPATAITAGTVNAGATGYEICVPANGDSCKSGSTAGTGGGLNAAQGIAVSQASGDVYVTEQGNRRVSRFDAAGNFIRTFGRDVIAPGFPGNSPAASAVQTLTVTATEGKYKLKFGGQETPELPFNATATEIQTALRALTSIGGSNVNVAGAGPYTITFAGTLANNPEPLITAESGPGEPLVGGTATVDNTITGSNELEICAAGNLCKAGAAANAIAGGFGALMGHPAVAPAGAPNEGNVLVADATNVRVQEFSAAGAFIRAFGQDVVAAGPSNSATSFEVCRLAAGDACKAGTAGSGSGQFGAATPTRVVEDASGNIYTVEPLVNFRVQKFTLPGNVPTPQGPFALADLTGTSSTAPLDVAVNPTAGSNVLVTKAFAAGATASCPITGTASAAERRVLEVSSAGTLEGTHGTCAGITAAQANDSGLGTRQSTGELYLAGATPASRLYVLNTGQPAAPSAVITNVSGLDAHRATISAFVNPNGPELPYGTETGYRFEYKPSAEPAWAQLDSGEARAGNRTTNKLVTLQLSNLEAGTSYDVRLVATKPFGSGSATHAVTFSTPEAAPEPIVMPSIYLDGSTAVFGGAVKPNNSPTGYHFEYVDDAGFQANGFADATRVPSSDASAGGGASPVPVAQEVADLDPGSYHLRLVATSGSGSAASTPTTFSVEASGNCANETIRSQQLERLSKEVLTEVPGSPPDCMALEMASPAAKEGQPVKDGGTLRNNSITFDGNRVLFRANAAFGETEAVVNVNQGDVYVAGRDQAGWTTRATNLRPMAAGTEPVGFDPDLGSWFQIAAETADLNSEFKYQAFRSTLGGQARPFSQLLLTADAPQQHANYAGSSADASHLYLKMAAPFGQAITPARLDLEDPRPAGTGARTNVYVLTLSEDGQPADPQLLVRDRFGRTWGGNCGARVGGDMNVTAGQQQTNLQTRVQGAIAPDGSRVYFSARPGQPPSGNCNPTNNKVRILERAETPEGVEITELVQNECSRVAPACDATDGDDYFQGASADGTKVYFTTNRQLVDSDLDSGASCSLTTGVGTGCDLYLYEKLPGGGHKLIQVSAGDATDPAPGTDARILNNIAGISTDGTHVYFVAQGVLTTNPNEFGAVAKVGEPNLYLYERSPAHPGGRTAFIGALDPSDSGQLWGLSMIEAYGPSAVWPVPAMDPEGEEVGGDGHILLFKSNSELTPNDADGAKRDIYRYDSQSGSLQCVSCRPGGGDGEGAAREAEPAGLGGGTPQDPAFASLGRWVSEDGLSVVFETAAPLLPGDTDENGDEYLWRDGQVTLLPGDDLSEAATISGDGSALAIRRVEPLLPQDGDSVADMYVLRSGGGFSFPVEDGICVGEQCQMPFSPQPPAPSSPSETAIGGNVEEPPRCKPGLVRRNGKCIRKPCKKGFVRRKGKCVRRHAKGNQHDRKDRAATTPQGGHR